jgi:hypothetical protein
MGDLREQSIGRFQESVVALCAVHERVADALRSEHQQHVLVGQRDPVLRAERRASADHSFICPGTASEANEDPPCFGAFRASLCHTLHVESQRVSSR